MQYEHMLLQPRMIETNAETPSEPSRTGAISAYVSSSESATSRAGCPLPASASSRGSERYASGPHTRSARRSCAVGLSSSFPLSRSPMQPRTPTSGGRPLRAARRSRPRARSSRSRCQIFDSAPSRIAHVLSSTTSASAALAERP